MRVLALVTDAFGGHGGIALYNRDMLSALCAHDDITEVVAIARCADKYSDSLPEKLRYEVGGVSSGIAYLSTVFKIVRRNPRFKFILCCHVNLMPLAWLIGKILRIPIVLEIYGIEAWQPTRGKWLSGTLMKSANLIISISEYTRVRFLAWSNVNSCRCKILPNAIHLDNYQIRSKSQALLARYKLEGRRVLLTLGRVVSMERAKGFDEVIDILPELLLVHPDLVYIIAGGGGYLDGLKEKVSALNLTEGVIFTGFVNEEEKVDIYCLADVYVMPSRGEGFGFVFLEAMACGVPVIASSKDGSREAVLDGKLGAIVDPDSRAEIKRAIFDALEKPKVIPEKLEYFSYQNFTFRLHEIINEILVRDK